eukprot:CAMPEP_0201539928 /NCGR_PEP_ID=MMETSP0161_2-20130828/70669_1 /ASSEMBLY_ACC=CAM_ASM_000251 /TAXON_ID=180227 /ORGANISM="Neoparamoeba aestuarina, Strain SoJaBio B1-5/56/2" /LENGTH=183 /DNA_ID=CAMNT_0047947355 /DNA_START=636 /DNA_END=1187 /DNA_ORIENTATION=-
MIFCSNAESDLSTSVTKAPKEDRKKKKKTKGKKKKKRKRKKKKKKKEKEAQAQKPIVAMGSANWHFNKKGEIKTRKSSWFVNRLKKKLRVVMIPEYFTTKKCSFCYNVTETPHNYETSLFPRHLMRRAWLDQDVPRGLRKCNNGDCPRKFLHRDVNAARNILAVLDSQLKRGERPEYLRHKGS